jgi:DNA-binding transcriptional MerR regulator
MALGYSTVEVARAAGMTVRQVRYLASSGVVAASVRRTAGRGFPSMYAFADLLKLAVIQRLRATSGCDTKLERLRSVVEALDRHDGAAGRLLVIDDQACWIHEGELETLLDSGQAVLGVSLDAVEKAVRLQLRRQGLAEIPRAVAA